MSLPSAVRVGDVVLDNAAPMALIGGLNVLEDREMALRVAEQLQGVCERLGLPLIFKASFDKANRSSLHSYRGPGLETGLRILEDVRDQTGLPIVTDLHEAGQAAAVAEVAALLQIPAFLSRQTDLLAAAAATGRPLHLKKMQGMAPAEAASALGKCEALGASGVVLCERGTTFV